MARRRKENTRKVNSRILIFCEGGKTEPLYFEELIKECAFPGKLADVRVVKEGKTSGVELVNVAKKERKKEPPVTNLDQIWIVIDKDGYTKHRETFLLAAKANINIAFSSAAFEFWILLHLRFTTKGFVKSEEIISEIERSFPYTKNDRSIYTRTRDNLKTAIENAQKVRKHHTDINPHKTPYQLTPYTDVDELVLDIVRLHEQLARKGHSKFAFQDIQNYLSSKN